MGIQFFRDLQDLVAIVCVWETEVVAKDILVFSESPFDLHGVYAATPLWGKPLGLVHHLLFPSHLEKTYMIANKDRFQKNPAVCFCKGNSLFLGQPGLRITVGSE